MKVFMCQQDRDQTGLYTNRGHEITNSLSDADLVQFWGGEDVNPALYGRKPHPRTSFNNTRDTKELGLYRMAKDRNIPCVGICRGGQFLNVMNKGTMFQHVDGHIGVHKAKDVFYETEQLVNSTHHQMMVPGPSGYVLATAIGVSSVRQWVDENGVVQEIRGPAEDTEVIAYWHNDDLCFQPHPEYSTAPAGLKQYFYNVLSDFLGDKV